MTSTNSSSSGILKVDTKGRVRTPAAAREALLELFEQGGASGAAFARLHGLRYPTFMNWVQKRRKSRPQTVAPALFQELRLERADTSACTGLMVELPMGARVRVERPEQIPMVAALCRHLRENAAC